MAKHIYQYVLVLLCLSTLQAMNINNKYQYHPLVRQENNPPGGDAAAPE